MGKFSEALLLAALTAMGLSLAGCGKSADQQAKDDGDAIRAAAAQRASADAAPQESAKASEAAK